MHTLVLQLAVRWTKSFPSFFHNFQFFFSYKPTIDTHTHSHSHIQFLSGHNQLCQCGMLPLTIEYETSVNRAPCLVPRPCFSPWEGASGSMIFNCCFYEFCRQKYNCCTSRLVCGDSSKEHSSSLTVIA